jgi:hypothetical protein
LFVGSTIPFLKQNLTDSRSKISKSRMKYRKGFHQVMIIFWIFVWKDDDPEPAAQWKGVIMNDKAYECAEDTGIGSDSRVQ